MTIIHKFDTNKYEERKINWRGRRLSGVVILSIIALIVVEIWVSHTVATFGEKFSSIESVKRTIASENRFLEEEIAKNSAMQYVASQSATLGFTHPKDIKYIH
jgi:hypothetical protein